MKLGILGGIGPEASAYFYTELIRRLKESGRIKSNVDYPHVLINSINASELTMDEVSDAVLAHYFEGVRELAMHKPDFIVMVCNSIHVFRDRIIAESGYPQILSIREAVTEALDVAESPLCVLGMPRSVNSGLFRFEEYRYMNPGPRDLEALGEIVRSYNASGETKENRKRLLEIVERQKKNGAKTFLAACTEVSELLRSEKDIAIVDTLECLLHATAQRILRNS
jgi:aspartate racemase